MMKCPSCDYSNIDGASYCAWCKRDLPRSAGVPVQNREKKDQVHEESTTSAKQTATQAPTKTGTPRAHANVYALIGMSFALIWNYIFLAPHYSRYGKTVTAFVTAISITSLLCGLIGFYFARKIALTMSYTDSIGHGAIAGALVGAVNGTAVFPVLGTGIGAVIGLILGALCGPLMVLLCSGFGARR